MNKFNVINRSRLSDLALIEVGGFAVNTTGVIFLRISDGALRWINSATNPMFLSMESCRGLMVTPCDAKIELNPRVL